MARYRNTYPGGERHLLVRGERVEHGDVSGEVEALPPNDRRILRGWLTLVEDEPTPAPEKKPRTRRRSTKG